MIKYNHEEDNIPQAVGITKATEAVLDKAIIEAVKSDDTHSFSTIVEHIEKNGLKRSLKASEGLYIGMQLGANKARQSMMMDMIKSRFTGSGSDTTEEKRTPYDMMMSGREKRSVN